MRDSFAMVMPILIIGSMFTLLRNFPIPAWIDFLKTTMVQPDKSLFALLAIPSACTVSLMAIFLAFNIGYNFAEHIGIKDRASAGIVSLVSWFILMPQVTEFSPEEGVEPFLVDSIPLAWTGAKGVFIAMIVGFFAVGVFGYIIKKDWTIKMPEGVPPTVARAFSALIPMTVAFTAVWLVGIVFIISPWGNAFNFIYAILQAPLTSLGGTVWALAFSYVLASGFWFIGIHGPSIVEPAIAAITYANAEVNLNLLQQGMHADKILTSGTQMFIVTMGGTGATLVVPFMFMWLCKSKRNRAIGRASVVPTFFGVNEPILFGAPLVLNPIFFIPFIFAPIANVWIFKFFIETLGMNSFTANLPWTTPGPLGIVLGTNFQFLSFALAALLIVVDIVIYYPFLKVYDEQILEEERSGKANDELKEKVAANFNTAKADAILQKLE